MKYNFRLIQHDTYKDDPNYQILSQKKSGRYHKVTNYVSKKRHGLLWRLSHLAIAIFGSLATLGLLNISPSFRLYWKDAVTGKDHHRIFSHSVKGVKANEPDTNDTSGIKENPQINKDDQIKPSQEVNNGTEKINEGAECDLISLLQSGTPSIEKVKELCSKNKSWLTKTDCNGYTPLHLALNTNNHEIVAFLLEQNSVLLTKDQINERTPWHHACALGVSPKTLDLFLKKLSDRQLLQTCSGGNALHQAIRRRHKDVIKHLLDSEIGDRLAKQSFQPIGGGVPPQTPIELAQSKAKNDPEFKEIVEIFSTPK